MITPFEGSIIKPLEDHITEIDPINISNAGLHQDISPDQDISNQDISNLDKLDDINESDCSMLYGVVMETAHAIISTRNEAVTHRELPDKRRADQGKLLYHICKKYNIQIPTEFEVIIFGGALIADWQYMSAKESVEELKV